jgi:uncharacterized protein
MGRFAQLAGGKYKKAHHRLSYADAFVAASAQRNGAALLTGDPEFRALEGELHIEWLKR